MVGGDDGTNGAGQETDRSTDAGGSQNGGANGMNGNGGSRDDGAPEEIKGGGGQKGGGKITNYFNYKLKRKDCDDSRDEDEGMVEGDEKDDVGGSGGRNAAATILKWKTMMSGTTKGALLKRKTRPKPMKRGAKSGIREGHAGRAKLGKTDSSQWKFMDKTSPVEMGISLGSSRTQGYKGMQNFDLSCNIHNIVKTKYFDKGNKAETL